MAGRRMQDYDGPTHYHPLIGEGAWPDHFVNTLALLALIVVGVLLYAAYRAGRRAEIQQNADHRTKAAEIIFNAIRRQIDIALIATGEKAFGPVKILVDTIDAYLGPVLALAAGPNSLIGAVGKLKSALNTTKKKAAHDHHAGGSSSVIIAAGGNGSAVASAAAEGGSVQVVHPARIIEVPAHGGGHGDHGHGHEKEVEMTSVERVRAVREALEHLSDVWQKPKVIDDILAAQAALLITKSIPVPGTAAATQAPAARATPARERRAPPPRPEPPRRRMF